jgi:hypothetical protein
MPKAAAHSFSDGMDSPRLCLGSIVPADLMWCGVSAQLYQGELEMNAAATAVLAGRDLREHVFKLAVAD